MWSFGLFCCNNCGFVMKPPERQTKSLSFIGTQVPNRTVVVLSWIILNNIMNVVSSKLKLSSFKFFFDSWSLNLNNVVHLSSTSESALIFFFIIIWFSQDFRLWIIYGSYIPLSRFNPDFSRHCLLVQYNNITYWYYKYHLP